MSINQFVKLVKEMRVLQQRFEKKHSYLTPTYEDKNRMELERKVDKAIRDREKRLFSEEDAAQGTLF